MSETNPSNDQQSPAIAPEQIFNIAEQIATSPAPASAGTVDLPEILFLYIPEQISDSDVQSVLKEFDKLPTNSKGIIVINSPGGEIYSAVKLVDLIRARWQDVTYVIPYRAKSAATLMSLSANNIVMGVLSELGPLDLPYEHPHLEGQNISANDVVGSIESLQKLSLNFAIQQVGTTLRNVVKMSRYDAVKLALDYSKELVNPIMAKEDPRIYAVCLRLLAIATIYGKEFLEKYMFNPVVTGGPDPSAIVHKLVHEYPDHGFSIRREEARRIGLKVIYAEDYPLWGEIWKAHKLLGPQGQFIKLYQENELSTELSTLI